MVKKVRAKEGLTEQHALRVAVVGGGCSGFSYQLDFDDKAQDGDLVAEYDGVQVRVDPTSAQYLQGIADRLREQPARRRVQVPQPQRGADLRLRLVVLGVTAPRAAARQPGAPPALALRARRLRPRRHAGRLARRPGRRDEPRAASLGRAELPPALLYGFVGEGARRLVERALGAAPAARRRRGPGALRRAGTARTCSTHGAVSRRGRRPCGPRGARRRALRVEQQAGSHESGNPRRGSGLDALFLAIVGGDSLPSRKPDPAGVGVAPRGRRDTRRATLLLVGDSGVDVRDRGGRRASTSAASRGGSRRRRCGPSIPERVVETPSGLLAAIVAAASVAGARPAVRRRAAR